MVSDRRPARGSDAHGWSLTGQRGDRPPKGLGWLRTARTPPFRPRAKAGAAPRLPQAKTDPAVIAHRGVCPIDCGRTPSREARRAPPPASDGVAATTARSEGGGRWQSRPRRSGAARRPRHGAIQRFVDARPTRRTRMFRHHPRGFALRSPDELARADHPHSPGASRGRCFSAETLPRDLVEVESDCIERRRNGNTERIRLRGGQALDQCLL